jgi:predicted dehydrogenase
MASKERVKLAVVGGHRGDAFNRSLVAFADRVELTAVCDLAADVRARWQQSHPQIQTFASYEEMLDKADCTAVFIATPMLLHARQAIQALRAGRDVISEVIAATTLDECWELVESVEATHRVYMLAENYCYMRPNMMVLNMVRKGVFGELTHAEGAYIHDCRYLLFGEGDQTTWRAQMRRQFQGNTYPTHSLGPVAQWLGIGGPDGDRMASTATWMTAGRSAQRYAAEHLGADHPAAQDDFWRLGDSATTVIRTERGRVIVLRVDWASPRPHSMTHYVLQGDNASYISARHEHEDPLVWIDGVSRGKSPGDAEWESLWGYAAQYEHPRWSQWREQAEQAGHGGGDFFVLEDFLDAIQYGARPAIDVYDAVAWSSIMPLSIQSVARGSQPEEIPDFARERAALAASAEK